MQQRARAQDAGWDCSSHSNRLEDGGGVQNIEADPLRAVAKVYEEELTRIKEQPRF